MYIFTVPPNIDDSLTSSDVIVREGDNVTLRCKAKGSPEPSIRWKRDDGLRIVVNKSLEGKRDLRNLKKMKIKLKKEKYFFRILFQCPKLMVMFWSWNAFHVYIWAPIYA